MSNEYIGFCVRVEFFPEKREEVMKTIDAIINFDTEDLEYDDYCIPAELDNGPGNVLIKNLKDFEWLGVDIDIEGDELTLYCEDEGCVENAALIISILMQKDLIRLSKHYVTITYSCWSDKADDPEGFHGGGCVISRKGIRWMPSMETFIHEQCQDLFITRLENNDG